MNLSSKQKLGVVALVGAAFGLAVHILAIFRYTPLGMAPVFLLFLLAFPLFGAMISNLRSRARGPRFARFGIFDLIPDVPTWGKLLFAAVFIYAGINFGWFFSAISGGTVEQRDDGHYVLSDHGRFIRELDEDGVRAFHAWEVRAFSGHILVFLVLPGLYFLFATEPASEQGSHTATRS